MAKRSLNRGSVLAYDSLPTRFGHSFGESLRLQPACSVRMRAEVGGQLLAVMQSPSRRLSFLEAGIRGLNLKAFD